MLIRKYEPRDRDQVVEIWRTVLPDESPHNEPALVLAKKLAVDDLVLVAEHDGVLIGAAIAGYDGHRGLALFRRCVA